MNPFEWKMNHGQTVIVDAEDYEPLNNMARWYAKRHQSGKYYVMGYRKGESGKYDHFSMHRVLMNAPSDKYVDHKNGITTDNRKSNLRICTNAQNQWNRGISSRSTSGYKGVVWHKRHGKYMATMRHLGKNHFLGYHETAIEAAKAYDNLAKALHGEFAVMNLPA